MEDYINKTLIYLKVEAKETSVKELDNLQKQIPYRNLESFCAKYNFNNLSNSTTFLKSTNSETINYWSECSAMISLSDIHPLGGPEIVVMTFVSLGIQRLWHYSLTKFQSYIFYREKLPNNNISR